MTIRIKVAAQIAPDLTVIEKVNGDGTGVGTTEFEGVICEQQSALTNEFQIIENSLNGSLTYENLTPGVCSIEDFPRVTFVSSGSAKIKVSNAACSVFRFFGMTDAASDAIVPTGFVEGSYVGFSWDIIKPLLDSGEDSNLFSDRSTGAYNPACLAADFDFSGIPIGSGRNGILISPQHLWSTWHWQYSVGDTVSFASKSVPGLIVSRTIAGKSQDYGPGSRSGQFADNPVIRDMMIYTLDAPVPSSIEFYPIVGDWHRVFDGGDPSRTWMGIVGISLDQHRDVYAHLFLPTSYYQTSLETPTNLYGTTVSSYYRGRVINSIPDSVGIFSDYAGFLHTGIEGDSGCPAFVPLGNAELAVWTIYTGPSSGMPTNEQVMNLMIDSADTNAGISTGYTVTVAPDPTL